MSVPVCVASCHVTSLQNWFLLSAYHQKHQRLTFPPPSGKVKPPVALCRLQSPPQALHLMPSTPPYRRGRRQVKFAVLMRQFVRGDKLGHHIMPRFSTVHCDSCVSLIRHSELTLSASSCLWRRRGEKKKRKILNSLETPVPWAVWCHWTRPSLSRNRSGLVEGIHAGSACRGSKSCPRMVKYLRAWRGGLGGALILMGFSSFPSQTCCLKRFGWLVNLERNLGSSWEKKNKKRPPFQKLSKASSNYFTTPV